MKIKILDILNNIVNREEIPKEIKWRDKIWRYDTGIQDYIEKDNVLFAYGINNYRTREFLTDEVEIVTEEE